METPTATPAAPAPAAAPSAPSTPVSTPAAAPSTPAPAAPATSTATDSSLSIGERISQGWEKNVNEFKPEGEEPAAADPAAAAPETPAPDATDPNAPEVPATDPENPDPAPAATEPTDEFTLDDLDSLTPQGFAKELKTDPAAEKFFNDHPEIKNQVFAALRRDSETREIRQIFPTVDVAKEAATGHALMQRVDNKFYGATTKEGVSDFLNTWVEMALILDDKGQPKMDGQGRYEVHPALTNTFDTIFDNRLSTIEQQAKKSGDERLQAALEIIREATTPSSPASGEVPEELKPFADSLKARETQLNEKEQAAARQQQEEAKTANLQSIDRSESKAAETVHNQLKPLFAKSALSQFESQAALEKIGELVDAKLEANQTYKAVREQILSRPPSDAREKALTKHLLSYTQAYLGPIAAQIIREAKAGTLDRQTGTAEKKAAQSEASKTDPRGASISPTQSRPQTPDQMRSDIIKTFADAHGGDKPDNDYIIREMFKRTQQAPAAR